MQNQQKKANIFIYQASSTKSRKTAKNLQTGQVGKLAETFSRNYRPLQRVVFSA